MAAKKRGRKPTGNQVREAEVSFSLTSEDAAWFTKLADDLGFRSRSEMLTAIMERLRVGGMAPVTFFRVGWQIAQLAQLTGTSKGAGFTNPFAPLPPFELRDKPRPEPALPDRGMEPQEITQALRELKLELQTK